MFVLQSLRTVSTSKGFQRNQGGGSKHCYGIFFLARSSFVMSSVQFISVAQSCLTLCDPMNCSTLGLPVHHQLPEFTQTHVHRVCDAIQPSHPLSSPSPLAEAYLTTAFLLDSETRGPGVEDLRKMVRGCSHRGPLPHPPITACL